MVISRNSDVHIHSATTSPLDWHHRQIIIIVNAIILDGKMMLSRDVELIEGLPLAYIKSLNALVASDLHLGYESHMARSGVFVPKVNLRKILSDLEKGINGREVKRLIVVGDIKNDFSDVGEDEFNELYDIIKFCSGRSVEVTLIKGNHDNFIERYRAPFRIKVYGGEFRINDYMFAHGDKIPAIVERPKLLITGHEHPTIGIVNSIGRIERLRCFLYGKYGKVNLLVLPAISYFATGSDINTSSRERIMSPILKDSDIENAHAIAIGYGSTLDFGRVIDLRRANASE